MKIIASKTSADVRRVFVGLWGPNRFRLLQARLKDTALFARVGDSVPLKLFSVEVDPLRAFCYLHGFVERHNGDNETERFVPFLAGEPTPR